MIKSVLIKFVLATSIAILALVSIKTYLQMKEISQLKAQVTSKQQQVIALDAKQLVNKFVEDGSSQYEAMEAFGLLIKMMEDEGVLILNSQQTITAPSNRQFRNLSVSDIFTMAEKRGVDIEAFQKGILKKAEKDADKLIKKLESLQP